MPRSVLFLVLHISTWNLLHSFLFVPATISQAWVCSFHTKICGNCMSTFFYLSSPRSRRRYHRAQRDSNFLSVCHLSVCYETLPSLWDRSLSKFIFRFLRPLRGSVKIWYWPQSNSPLPNAPQIWPPQIENIYFLTYPPDPCRIINHGLKLNYKVRNCACADLSLLVLYVLIWNFVGNLLSLAIL